MTLAEPYESKLKDNPIEEKVKAIIQVAETLQELHSRKIYHGDIKSANVVRGSNPLGRTFYCNYSTPECRK